MVDLQDLPSPLADDTRSRVLEKNNLLSFKHRKSAKQISKRASSNAATGVVNEHDQMADGPSMDGRRKRVWKACERCRMKKTKCDGQFPCKRCQDDCTVCTVGVRKKVEYKQLPKGYAEVLEHTQLTLVATVLKLYSMVRSSQPWELGEPGLNEQGQPVVHTIAKKLGCISSKRDINLRLHSILPEDDTDMANLVHKLGDEEDEQAPEGELQGSRAHAEATTSRGDIDLSIYLRKTFGAGVGCGKWMMPSPQGFPDTSISTDIEFNLTGQDSDTAGFFSSQPPQSGNFLACAMAKAPNDVGMQFLRQAGLHSTDMLNHRLYEAGLEAIQPNTLLHRNPDANMGMDDPMAYSNFNSEFENTATTELFET